MSAHDIHAGAAHDAHDDHDHHDGAPHSSFSGYMTGFVLSIILTAIPFWLVMAKVIEGRTTTVMLLGLFAIVQILVHVYYFLHLNSKVEAGWTLVSTIFTVIFVLIGLAGTLWVMYHMNVNMMPSHDVPVAVVQHHAS
jgi:cytochrome o ubiquinol oxidase operon protein cyoD